MALNEEIIQKRLKHVKIAQESVEAISSWVLHHVKYVSTISRVWFDVYLTANDELRISLIYVMNDVCQKSRKSPKEQFVKITSSFFHHLRYAIQLSNDKVKEKIKRVIGILKERQIFGPHKIDELNKILSGELTKEFPTDRSFSENVGKQMAEGGRNVKNEYDKYYCVVQRYLSEEGIYRAFRKREHENDALENVKRPKLSPDRTEDIKEMKHILEEAIKKVSMEIDLKKNNDTTGINFDEFMKPVRDTKDGLERAEQITSLTQKLQQSAAAEIAKQEGKEGVLNRKTLGLEHSTQPESLKDLPEIEGTSYDSWKHIRSERIKQLKKKVSSEIKNGDSEKYSPTKTGHESLKKLITTNLSPAKKSLSFNESEEANQFLNSIPLPKDPVASAPQMPPPSLPQISPTRVVQPPMSMNYDVAPPGVDFPPPLQIPQSHQQYDPTAMYSPTDPSGYYPNTGMMFPPTQSQIMSPPPRFYTPISPTSQSSHVYNNNFGQQRPRFPGKHSNTAYYDPNFYSH
jgi:hypothetical protein